jgi:hypothetical protein
MREREVFARVKKRPGRNSGATREHGVDALVAFVSVGAAERLDVRHLAQRLLHLWCVDAPGGWDTSHLRQRTTSRPLCRSTTHEAGSRP